MFIYKVIYEINLIPITAWSDYQESARPDDVQSWKRRIHNSNRIPKMEVSNKHKGNYSLILSTNWLISFKFDWCLMFCGMTLYIENIIQRSTKFNFISNLWWFVSSKDRFWFWYVYSRYHNCGIWCLICALLFVTPYISHLITFMFKDYINQCHLHEYAKYCMCHD